MQNDALALASSSRRSASSAFICLTCKASMNGLKDILSQVHKSILLQAKNRFAIALPNRMKKLLLQMMTAVIKI